MNTPETMIGSQPTGRVVSKNNINHICNRFIMACMRGDDFQEAEAYLTYKKTLPLEKGIEDGN